MNNIVTRLRAKTYGHGAFGESETYHPPQINLDAANEIVHLEGQLRIAKLHLSIVSEKLKSLFNEEPQ